jgi:hypothetical protein
MGSTSPVEAFVVGPKSGAIVQTLVGIGAAPDSHTLIAPGFTARLDAQAAPGISDQIGFDPAGGVSFSTGGARKPLTVGITTRVQGLVQSAELTTNSLQGTVDEFRFDETRAGLVYHHAGPPARFRLRLSSVGKNAPAIAFESESLQIGAGETATLAPNDWSRLGIVAMTVRDMGGHERHAILQNRFKPRAIGRVVALDVDDADPKRPHTRPFEVVSRLGELPPNSQAAIAWTARKEGRVVGSGAKSLREAEVRSGRRRDRFVFTAPAGGHYTMRADLVVVTTEGLIQAADTNSRSAGFVIR